MAADGINDNDDNDDNNDNEDNEDNDDNDGDNDYDSKQGKAPHVKPEPCISVEGTPAA